MAYNPSMYGYYAQPNQWAQPVQQATPGYMYQSAQPVNGVVSVTGVEGARAYQLPPNSSMPLFDQDNDILYLKTTDSAGYPTIKQFAFKPVEQAQEAPRADYVPRSEFDALVAQVQELASQPRTRTRKAATDGE